MASDQILKTEYDRGFTDAQEREEAFPGCPVSEKGRAYMRGYIDGAKSRKG